MSILLHFHPICDSNQVKLFFLSAKNRLPFSVNDGSKGINKRSGRSVLYDRTGLSTIRFLVKTGFKILRALRRPNSDLCRFPNSSLFFKRQEDGYKLVILYLVEGTFDREGRSRKRRIPRFLCT